MSEMILPGTYIEVRPEGLIVPGRVSVNNVGVAGTAGKGPVDTPTFLSSYTEAREVFGDYDAWDENNPGQVLTLTRALEQVFSHGATTVLAVRIANGEAQASFMLNSAGGDCVNLQAQSAGEWGNNIEVNVTDADAHSFISNEQHNGGAAISLSYTPIVESARNRITHFIHAEQRTRILNILYAGVPGPGQVQIDINSGALTFAAGEEPASADDRVTASYVVNQSASAKVTVRYGSQEEVYIVANGNDLAADINIVSGIVSATPAGNAAEPLTTFASALDFQFFGTGTNTRGDNGAVVSPADYKAGLDRMMNEPAHIMVAAGQSHTDIGADLTAHVTTSSSDANKRERIGVVGSALGDNLDAIRGHSLNSDRIVFVAPGIKTTDAASGKQVILPGAYAAAAVAGLLASYSPHVSLTNKPLPVVALQHKFSNAELTQLVQSRVLALQDKLGFKVLKGITTSTNTAWHQITTRRIVDYAKFGVRSAADPYIGLLNNTRVRGALRATINSFLAEMVEDEMLISYDLDVSATREEERQGIARVIIVLRPVFSIDFIKVTMFLE
jgi:hypothetical protein